MQLRLKTKITLTTAALVLAVVGVNSTLYVMNLARQVIRQANARAQLVSRHIFFEAQNALADAAKSGGAPASDSVEDLRAYVQQAFDDSAPLSSAIDSEVGYSPLIYEVSVTDVNGTVLVSSDKSLPGNATPARTNLSQLVSGTVLNQLNSSTACCTVRRRARMKWTTLSRSGLRAIRSRLESCGSRCRRACCESRLRPHCVRRRSWRWLQWEFPYCLPRW